MWAARPLYCRFIFFSLSVASSAKTIQKVRYFWRLIAFLLAIFWGVSGKSKQSEYMKWKIGILREDEGSIVPRIFWHQNGASLILSSFSFFCAGFSRNVQHIMRRSLNLKLLLFSCCRFAQSFHDWFYQTGFQKTVYFDFLLLLAIVWLSLVVCPFGPNRHTAILFWTFYRNKIYCSCWARRKDIGAISELWAFL